MVFGTRARYRFGTAPLDIIEREFALFGHAVSWFFDATGVEYATRSLPDLLDTMADQQ